MAARLRVPFPHNRKEVKKGRPGTFSQSFVHIVFPLVGDRQRGGDTRSEDQVFSVCSFDSDFLGEGVCCEEKKKEEGEEEEEEGRKGSFELLLPKKFSLELWKRVGQSGLQWVQRG